MRYEPKVPMDLSTWDSGEKTLAAVMRALVETTSYVNDTMRLSQEWGRGISLFMRVQVPASRVEELRTKLGKLAELKEPPQVHLNTTKSAPQPAPAHAREEPERCGCRACLTELDKTSPHHTGLPRNSMTFVVCATCGNKRCPKASDHRHACTNSNEPGQAGSVYGDPNAAAPPAPAAGEDEVER